MTIHIVDWADEEGARFGRSLTGSAASAGSLDPHRELAHLVDRGGVKLPDALKENGITLEGMKTARQYFDDLRTEAYLELHIEQGPVLQEMRRWSTWSAWCSGRWASSATSWSSSGRPRTPVPRRCTSARTRSSQAPGSRSPRKKVATKLSGRTPRTRVVATFGVVKVEPNFVTAVPSRTEISIDLRALDAAVLAKLLAGTKKASLVAAKEFNVKVEWSPILKVTSRIFDETLTGFVRKAVKGVTGYAPEIPSGPLHDAAEMADIVPTAMVFAQSSPGISHTRIEDTPEPALDKSVRAFLATVEQTVEPPARKAQPRRKQAAGSRC